MDLVTTLQLLGVVALAAYIQTVTGFAFGLTLMGGAVLLEIAPVPVVAILISILSLFNCVMALYRNVGNLDRQIIVLCSVSSVVTLFVGVWALDRLITGYVGTLQLILGGAIIVSSLMLVIRPKLKPVRSGPLSFLAAGTVSGLLGGMFSTSGPPLVFHFYRQPLARTVIRDTLLLIFSIHSVQRIAIVSWQGALTVDILAIALTALPVVLAVTWLARRFPPQLSDRTLRRVAFALLMVSGFSLCLTALNG